MSRSSPAVSLHSSHTNWGFERTSSSPSKSKAYGKAESAVKTTKNLLRKAKCAKTDPYMAILNYRNTPSRVWSTVQPRTWWVEGQRLYYRPQDHCYNHGWSSQRKLTSSSTNISNSRLRRTTSQRKTRHPSKKVMRCGWSPSGQERGCGARQSFPSDWMRGRMKSRLKAEVYIAEIGTTCEKPARDLQSQWTELNLTSAHRIKDR